MMNTSPPPPLFGVGICMCAYVYGKTSLVAKCFLLNESYLFLYRRAKPNFTKFFFMSFFFGTPQTTPNGVLETPQCRISGVTSPAGRATSIFNCHYSPDVGLWAAEREEILSSKTEESPKLFGMKHVHETLLLYPCHVEVAAKKVRGKLK